ncbi:hypothetical protein DEA8626_01418 [Defluviimonas aquaemixtae]|uniref:Invasion associated locus B (IalB) protein n=1 Tax=Albidovulum aquaemixtae TaxID=1542388 RepID=A0A2R8B5V6_9RHOB|nr:invasion associated locus B family protein [Defluviimonas aquaemixtae]SPH17890.1 hypothetical protein DEA8626_01418 [Defluviimonas aquaemixtae]
MAAFPNHLTLALALLAAGPLAAQDTSQDTAAPESAATETEQTEAAPADPATTPADGMGEPYVAETHGDWQLRCVRTDDGSDPCQLYQLLKDRESGQPISEISILALPEGGEAAAGATVITPLETLLTQQLNITVDGGQTKRYPFTFCTEVGCVARVGFTAEDLAGFRKGKVAVISVVPVADPTRTVDVDISLAGFTAGFASLAKTLPQKQE